MLMAVKLTVLSIVTSPRMPRTLPQVPILTVSTPSLPWMVSGAPVPVARTLTVSAFGPVFSVVTAVVPLTL